MEIFEKILKGVQKKIIENFSSSEYEIYEEIVEQDLKEPCFFVRVVDQKYNNVLGKRYKSTCSAKISYFPKTKNIKECNKICEILNEITEIIDCGDVMCIAAEANSEIVDFILHFYVDYNVWYTRKAETEKINKITTRIRVGD